VTTDEALLIRLAGCRGVHRAAWLTAAPTISGAAKTTATGRERRRRHRRSDLHGAERRDQRHPGGNPPVVADDEPYLNWPKPTR
jgi:hypothetical protein